MDSDVTPSSAKRKALGAMISRDECVLWIGLVLLELRSQSNEGSVMESSFLREWEQQLPEAWREHAKINVLKVCERPVCACFMLTRLTPVGDVFTTGQRPAHFQ